MSAPRGRSVRGVVALALMGLVACDAHVRAAGRVVDPGHQAIPGATVTVQTYPGRVHKVQPDGGFEVSLVHGGSTTWVFEAPGYRRVSHTFRGTGQFRCTVSLVPDNSPQTLQSQANCEKASAD